MKVIYLDGFTKMNNPSTVSAIGFFDGMHVGHMELVNEVMRVSKEKNYKKALMTFDHHPLYILGKMKEEYYLSSMKDRIEILESMGIDYLYIIRFSSNVAALSPEEFIQNYIVSNNIKHLVCGFDFRFGKSNEGDVNFLQKHTNLDISIIDEVVYESTKISSTRIREELNNGHMELVTTLLGRNYSIYGKVISGRKIGRSIGFPTANVDYSSYLLPDRGVYAVHLIYNHKTYLGMCNIGYNPTVGSLKQKSLEVHIFDFNENIYDQEVKVIFLKKTRGEFKFKNIDELIQQLEHDKKYIQENFN